MKRLLFSFCTIFLFLSCSSSIKDEKEENIYEILSLLTDEFGKPTIPPREIYNLKPFTEMQIDSIYNQIEKITLYPILYTSNRVFSDYKNSNKEYNELVKNLRNLKERREIDLSKIKINRPYQLSIIDTLAMKGDRRYVEKNFDKLINFSQISFNQDCTKGVVVVGVNMGPLNGYASLVFLEKKNGKWKIKGTDTLSIS